MAQAGNSQLHITVLTASDRSLDLASELRLVKAALLYADRVTLVSAGVQYRAVGSRLIELVRPGYFDKLGLKRVQGPQREAVSSDIDQTESGWRQPEQLESIAKKVQAIAQDRDEPAVVELLLAHDAGFLEMDDMGIFSGSFAKNMFGVIQTERGAEYPSGLAASIADRLSTVIGPSAATFPMFDARVRDLLLAAGSDNKGVRVRARAATEPHLAASFIGKMVAFPDARMDEILDVRRELADPLVRFRSAVAGMARQMEETPMNEEFRQVADTLYRETVAPALLEIRDLERERGYRTQLARHVKDGAGIPDIEKTITLAATAYFMLPGLGYAAAGLFGTAASAAVKLATTVAGERDKLAKERRTNKFLFLPEAERRLVQ